MSEIEIGFYAFLAGVFFILSIAGWVLLNLQQARAIRAEERARYLEMQWTQSVHHNHALAAAVQKLQAQLRELGEDDIPGDEWKFGNN